MEYIEDAWNRSDLPHGVVATIGNYDGVHLGQRAILERVVDDAGKLGLPAAVVTFSPHPLEILAPAEAPTRLLAPAQKRELLAAAGVDLVAEVAFDEIVAQTPAEEFVRAFLSSRLGIQRVRVGSRFTFGRRRLGNLEMLEQLGRELGFEATGEDEVEFEGTPVSSTRIREAVARGDTEGAAALLGRRFALRGTIVEGQRQGRGLGWPTINLRPVQNAIPARGVYLSEVRFPDAAEVHPAVTNIGVRPTVSEGREEVVEAHILDFSADVYGKEAEIRFHARLRDEKAFPDIHQLKSQIQRDVDRARRYFSASADRPAV